MHRLTEQIEVRRRFNIGLFLVLALAVHVVHAQDGDTLQTKRLEAVIVRSTTIQDVNRLPDVESTNLWSGKKNEVISLQHLDANIAEKTPRQIFAKVPGVFVYDMDGSGNQVNISTRGLDPHRGWEFNIRKNGVITNSDMYGYPASHYSMPMEAVDQIRIIRGTGSLQYGAQFGGMLNYVTKTADTTRAISLESINTAGSFGLLSTYNAIGGKVGKFEYYVYYNKRVSEGYRDNGKTNYDAQSFMIRYSPVRNLSLKVEVARSNYIYQIPGPLTDSMFRADPKQATRSRNYFNPEIYVPSLTVDWKVGERSLLTWTTSAVLGNRNSVQFDKPATVKDGIDPVTLQYAARQVDIDNFNSYTSELRFLHRYTLGGWQGTLLAGVQVMDNDLHRRQQGKGTTGTNFDLALTQPGWGRDLHFKTKNIAIFVENSFRLTDRFTVSPGARVESGSSVMNGVISYYAPADVPNTISHHFPLLGVNAQYKLGDRQNVYGGWSQAYRPVVFKDIIPVSVYERADKNLKDAYGYNIEAGYRGNAGSLRWDVGVFQLSYKNRLGSLSGQDENGDFYLLRTNIGNSLTRGVELFAEYAFHIQSVSFSLFTSGSYMDARYHDAHVKSGDNNVSVDGNKVESVPAIISRNGFNMRYKQASVSLLYSYTAESYADALNTVKPSATGSVGLVPSYGILDFNSSIRLSGQVMVRLNVNNILDKQYFTKRPQFYPGPGVWSSDGRSMNVTVACKL